MNEHEHDRWLCERAKQGDLAAYEELFLKYNELGHTWTRKWIYNEALANDTADAGVTKAFTKLKQCAPIGQVRSWIYRVVYTTAMTALLHDKRARTSTVPLTAMLEDMIPAATGPEEEFRDTSVREEVEKLAPKQRDVIVATVLNGETVKEYAERKGISERTGRRRRDAGLAVMRRRLTRKFLKIKCPEIPIPALSMAYGGNGPTRLKAR